MGNKLKRRPPQGDSSDQLVRNLAEWAAILARHQRIFGIGAELVTTVCPDPGLSLGTYFELCLAEPSGATISCPTPPKVIICGGLAWFKV